MKPVLLGESHLMPVACVLHYQIRELGLNYGKRAFHFTVSLLGPRSVGL